MADLMELLNVSITATFVAYLSTLEHTLSYILSSHEQKPN